MKRYLILPVLALAGCVGTDVGNPPDDDSTVIAATLEFESFASEDALPGALRGRVDLDAAWLAIEDIRVRHGDCRGDSALVTIDGPFFVDLVKGKVLPAPPVIEGAREICSLKVNLGVSDAENVPTPLVGRSVFVQGSDENGEFLVESATPRALPYRAEGFVVANGGRYVDAFDTSLWGESLGARREANNDVGENDVVSFFKAMRDGSRIVLDSDEDGKVSLEEHRQPLALPDPSVDP